MLHLFQRYNLLYEWLESHCHTFFSLFPLLLFASTVLLGSSIRRTKRESVRLVVLSVAGILIQASFFIPEIQRLSSVMYIRLLGLFLLIVYATVFGLRSCRRTPNVRTLHTLALGSLIFIVALKATYLEQWPPVLTDYAATTGKDGILLSQQFSLMKLFPRNQNWVSGGGQSIIHAPLLLLNLKVFGYSTLAVRLTEVLYSTATLGILWLILSRTIAPVLALGGVVLFGLSAEHLSFSRIGTYYSASQALGLLILSLWLQFSSKASKRYTLLLPIGVFSLLSLFGYAPIRAVLLFSCIQALCLFKPALRFITMLQRHRRLLIMASIAIVTIALLFISNLSDQIFFYRSKLPNLPPTDIPVWYKAEGHNAAKIFQSPLTIINNIYENLALLLDESTRRLTFGLHPLLAFSTFLLFALSVVGLFSNQSRLISTFLLLSFLPQLLVHPLARRGILYRPFVPVCLLLFIYEYWNALKSVIQRRWITQIVGLLLLVAVGTIPAKEIYSFTKFNGPTGVGPSFGPEYVQSMLEHLKRLDQKIPLVIINANYSADKYRMALANRIYRDREHTAPVYFIEINENSSITDVPRADGPVYIGILNEEYRRDMIPWLSANIPGIKIESFGDEHSVFYWIGYVGVSQ